MHTCLCVWEHIMHTCGLTYINFNVDSTFERTYAIFVWLSGDKQVSWISSRHFPLDQWSWPKQCRWLQPRTINKCCGEFDSLRTEKRQTEHFITILTRKCMAVEARLTLYQSSSLVLLLLQASYCILWWKKHQKDSGENFKWNCNGIINVYGIYIYMLCILYILFSLMIYSLHDRSENSDDRNTYKLIQSQTHCP